MPFQNIISMGPNVQRTPVLSVDIGPDLLDICNTIINLNAEVIIAPGDNLSHTYIWEQTSGTPVSFSTSLTGLSISYTSNGSSDNIFRFTVDKNTSIEIFDELTVFGTPTSNITSNNDTNVRVYTDCKIVNLLFRSNPNTIDSCGITSSYTLLWTEPNCGNVVKYLIQRKPGLGDWITFDQKTNNEELNAITPNITDTFRVLTIFEDGDHYPSNMIYFIDPILSGILNNTLTASNNTNIHISNYNVDNLSLITKSISLNLTASNNTNIHISNYTIDDLSLITKSISLNLTASNNTNIHISNYELDDLTAIQIGG